MSEYRRFISYIYEYPGGRKGNNCGYAKAEVRSGMLRLYLHLQPSARRPRELQVYGFVRHKQSVLGILLGKAVSRGGAWEFQLNCAASGLGQSAYAVDDLRGVWLRGAEGENYITVWDDEPVSVSQFASLEDMREAYAQAQDAPRAAEDVSPGDAAGEISQAEGSARMQNAPRTAQDAFPGRGAGEISQAEGSARMQNVPRTAQDALPGGDAGEVSRVQRKAQTDQGGLTAAEEAETGRERAQPGSAQAPSGSLARRWEHFLNHYPQIQPFSDGEITQCIRIAPKDLSFLQTQEWGFSRNTFLRQAYMNYHHLLLGCHQSGRFVLGVPGVCRDAQERHLARMYGFPYFKEIRGEETAELTAAGGQPHPEGYWYHFLNEECPK